MLTSHRIAFWRLRQILQQKLYPATAVTSSIGGGWFSRRKGS